MFKDKNVTVVGLGKTGVALINYLYAHGANIFVSETKTLADIADTLQTLKHIPFKLETGAHTELIFKDKDLIVVSPGVDIEQDIFRKAAQFTEVISEIELAYRLLRGKLIAVTGTKGKSTTTALIYEILKSAQIEASLGGNIGNPLINEIDKISDDGYLVSEVSTFQLEGTRRFKPFIAFITNITEDHLDRHKSMEKYINLKSKIFENQTKEDFLILNYDNPICRNLYLHTKANVCFFSRQEKLKQNGVFLDNDAICLSSSEGKITELATIDQIKLRGAHNIENVLAACCVMPILNIKPESLRSALKQFKALPHRLEFVREINGVKFYDDSKGTNPSCVISAVYSFSEPVILIAGGRPKETDFSLMAETIAEKVKYFVSIGEAKDLLAEKVLEYKNIPIYKTNNFEEAVKTAYKNADKGDVVLLSPACTSFDMFKNAEERGNKFKEIVNMLASRVKGCRGERCARL